MSKNVSRSELVTTLHAVTVSDRILMRRGVLSPSSPEVAALVEQRLAKRKLLEERQRKRRTATQQSDAQSDAQVVQPTASVRDEDEHAAASTASSVYGSKSCSTGGTPPPAQNKKVEESGAEFVKRRERIVSLENVLEEERHQRALLASQMNHITRLVKAVLSH